MSDTLSAAVALFLKSAAFLFIANEARGLVLAAPVLYAMYEAGGTLLAIWIGFCSLAGIALSVVVPLFLAKRFKLLRLRDASLASS